MDAPVLLPRYRFERVEATVHWAHVELAIELELASAGDGPCERVDIVATVHDLGDYWDTAWVPRTASLQLSGARRPGPAPGLVSIALEPSAADAGVPALRSMTFDPAAACVSWLHGPGLTTAPMPDFWDPLVTWAREVWAAGG